MSNVDANEVVNKHEYEIVNITNNETNESYVIEYYRTYITVTEDIGEINKEVNKYDKVDYEYWENESWYDAPEDIERLNASDYEIIVPVRENNKVSLKMFILPMCFVIFLLAVLGLWNYKEKTEDEKCLINK